MSHKKWIFILFILSVFPVFVFSADSLPYDTRTKNFSSYGATVRGDVRTVGMAGATIGLGDTLLGAFFNPAGLAMTVPTSGFHLSRTSVFDGNIQNPDNAMTSTALVAGGPLYPWGFAMGFQTTNAEGQNYQVVNHNREVNLEVYTTEFHMSAARLFMDYKLSLGGSIIVGKSRREVNALSPAGLGGGETSYGIGIRLGMLYQFPNRWILGATYKAPIEYDGNPSLAQNADVKNFTQRSESPREFNLGIGWVPNRIFRIGTSVAFVGEQRNSALVSDESIALGESSTIQPSIGATYKFYEKGSFDADMMMGTYLESSRINGKANRVHYTFGLDVNPWIMDIGVSLDISSNYKNFIFHYGLNVVRTMQAIGWAKKPEKRKFREAGLFPKPDRKSERGLPRALVKNPVNQRDGKDLKELKDDIEKNVQKVRSEIDKIIDISKVKNRKKKKKKRKKRRRKPVLSTKQKNKNIEKDLNEILDKNE